MNKIVILTGLPRSGSSLSCNILNNYENTLALLEPMDTFPDAEKGKENACTEILEFVLKCRTDVLQRSEVYCRHMNGVIPTNPIDDIASGELRKSVVKPGYLKLNRKFDKNFRLVIKQNAFFTAVLDEIVKLFPCYGIIRNPLSVLASWNTVQLPVNRGHIPMGEKFDLDLYHNLLEISGVLDRQIFILNWFFERFDRYLIPENILKYEDIIDLNGGIFSSLSYNGKLESQINELTSRNTNSLYMDVGIDVLYNRLLESDGMIWKYYDKSDVNSVYHKMNEKFNHR